MAKHPTILGNPLMANILNRIVGDRESVSEVVTDNPAVKITPTDTKNETVNDLKRA